VVGAKILNRLITNTTKKADDRMIGGEASKLDTQPLWPLAYTVQYADSKQAMF